MALSKKWNMTDNVYTQSRSVSVSTENNNVIGLFQKVITGEVDPCIIDFAKKNSKKETYLYNNRLFFGISNPSEIHKEQYNINWKYINSLPNNI